MTVTRPSRRTESRARRQAAGLVAQRRRRARRADLEDLSRRRRLRRDQSEADALAYALARMPATYAAVTASLNALREIRPDFAPASLLDVGAGPGTATWAAAEAFPSLQSFASARRQRRACARWRLISAATARACATWTTSAATPAPRSPTREAADLVVASYMIGEIERCRAKERSPSCCGPKPATRCWWSSPARPRAMRGSSRCGSN